MIHATLLVTLLRAGVVALVTVGFGAVFTVGRLHWLAYRRLPPAAGLVPLHVALVSLSVLIFQGTLAWALIEAFGQPATPAVTARVALFGVATVVLLASLVVVGRKQRRRLEFVRAEDPDLERDRLVVRDRTLGVGPEDRA